jgi:hypothetical protein
MQPTYPVQASVKISLVTAIRCLLNNFIWAA